MQLLVPIALSATLVCTSAPCPSAQPSERPDSKKTFVIHKVFHVVGIPSVRRNARGDLVLTDHQLIFRTGKKAFTVPYARVERVLLFSGERHYAKTAMAAAAATQGIGGLLMLKKKKLDALAVDFRNDRGGLMGIALQVPAGEGVRCRGWLARFGVLVEEPGSTDEQ